MRVLTEKVIFIGSIVAAIVAGAALLGSYYTGWAVSNGALAWVLAIGSWIVAIELLGRFVYRRQFEIHKNAAAMILGPDMEPEVIMPQEFMDYELDEYPEDYDLPPNILAIAALTNVLEDPNMAGFVRDWYVTKIMNPDMEAKVGWARVEVEKKRRRNNEGHTNGSGSDSETIH